MSFTQSELRPALLKKMHDERLTYKAVAEATGYTAVSVSKFCRGGNVLKVNLPVWKDYLSSYLTTGSDADFEAPQTENLKPKLNYELYGKVFVALLQAGKTEFMEQADFLWSDLGKIKTGDVPAIKIRELLDCATLIYKVYGENEIFSNDLYFKKLPDGSLELSYQDSDLETDQD